MGIPISINPEQLWKIESTHGKCSPGQRQEPKHQLSQNLEVVEAELAQLKKKT